MRAGFPGCVGGAASGVPEVERKGKYRRARKGGVCEELIARLRADRARDG